MLHKSLVAAIAWTFCCSVFHLDEEVSLIWRPDTTWSLRATYAIVRYAPILHETVGFFALFGRHSFSAVICISKEWMIQRVLVSAGLALLIAVPLVSRARSLRHKTRNANRLATTALIAEVVAMTITLGIAMSEESLLSGCLLASSPSLRRFLAYLLFTLLLELSLFVFTLRRFMTHARETYRTRYGPLLRALLSDGAWVAAMIFASIYYQLGPNASHGVGYFWLLCMMSFTGSRIILGMTKFTEERPHESLPVT